MDVYLLHWVLRDHGGGGVGWGGGDCDVAGMELRRYRRSSVVARGGIAGHLLGAADRLNDQRRVAPLRQDGRRTTATYTQVVALAVDVREHLLRAVGWGCRLGKVLVLDLGAPSPGRV